MKADDIHLISKKPIAHLEHYVESFWMVKHTADTNKEIIVLPDGRFDIIFSYSIGNPITAVLRGLDTKPEQATINPNTIMFAVSFKLLAIEYLLGAKMASVLNNGQHLPKGFWNITSEDLGSFETCCEKITVTLLSLLKPEIDKRKQKLFELIYTSNGSLTVHELADHVGWSSRQINRYFTERFGISLKSYCNILRFRASLQQIKEGRLFPEQHFADQTHFIKEIKKFSGVVPKELAKNSNDRFILLSGLSKT